MRELNIREKVIIKKDLIPFEKYLNNNGLFYDKVKNKYKKINFYVETRSELGEGLGRIRNNSQTGEKKISILDSLMNNEKERAGTCYHEIGHALMGMASYDRKDLYDKVLKYIDIIKNTYPNELLEEKYTYFFGMQCLEEYLLERFSQEMLFRCKGIEKNRKKKLICPGICADYTYESSLETLYGIFETIGEELIIKTFGNIDTAIISGLKEEYFESFFKIFDGKEIMLILGNLGKVYQSIMYYANNLINNYRYYPPKRVKCFLLETKELVNNIELQKQKKKQLNIIKK